MSIKPTLEDLYNRAPKVITDLLAQLELHKREDYPNTCGGCGTPAAQCDMNCADAASMAQHDAAIHRAMDWLGAVENRKLKEPYVKHPEKNVHARTNCIFAHKPDSSKFKLGDVWTCPTCGRKHTRVEYTKHNGAKITWESL